MTTRRVTETIEAQGEWLFRHRGTMGLAWLPLLLLAIGFPGAPVGALNDGGVDDLTTVGMAISFMGLLLRWLTVAVVPEGTSGRNTREKRALVLNTDAAYSVLRHPLYLANGIAVTGFLVATGSFWFAALTLAAYVLVIERIVAAEECYLERTFGSAYREWVARTPGFAPDFSRWRRPHVPVSVRTVLRREYNGVLAATLAFFALELTRDVVYGNDTWTHWVRDDGIWCWALGLGLASFVVLRTLKRATRILHVAGR